MGKPLKKGELDSASAERQASPFEILRTLEEATDVTPHDVSRDLMRRQVAPWMLRSMLVGSSTLLITVLGLGILPVPVAAMVLVCSFAWAAGLLALRVAQDLRKHLEGETKRFGEFSGAFPLQWLCITAPLFLGGLLGTLLAFEGWVFFGLGAAFFGGWLAVHLVGRLIFYAEDKEVSQQIWLAIGDSISGLSPFFEHGRRNWRRAIQMALRVSARAMFYGLVLTGLALVGISAHANVFRPLLFGVGATLAAHWLQVVCAYWFTGYLSGEAALQLEAENGAKVLLKASSDVS